MPARKVDSKSERPDCFHCVHFFVTWEPDRSRGCRAYEFKSPELPSEVVLASSGKACQLYEPKGDRGPRKTLLR